MDLMNLMRGFLAFVEVNNVEDGLLILSTYFLQEKKKNFKESTKNGWKKTILKAVRKTI
jgi:hypothetical protein